MQIVKKKKKRTLNIYIQVIENEKSYKMKPEIELTIQILAFHCYEI